MLSLGSNKAILQPTNVKQVHTYVFTGEKGKPAMIVKAASMKEAERKYIYAINKK